MLPLRHLIRHGTAQRGGHDSFEAAWTGTRPDIGQDIDGFGHSIATSRNRARRPRRGLDLGRSNQHFARRGACVFYANDLGRFLVERC